MLAPLLALLTPCIPADRPADLLQERGGRPALTGAIETTTTDDGGFRLHWTYEGDDRVDPTDTDQDGVPDYVARVRDALDFGRSAYAELGYRAVPPDDGAGGDAAVDLYVADLPVNGYATPEPAELMSCVMQIDPGLSTLGTILESVVIHELHHCVQYAYSVDAESWIYEATATYEQYGHVTDDALQAALDVLWNSRLRGADRPLRDVDDRFEYAGFVLLKFLEERGEPDRQRPVRLWEALERAPDWRDALDELADAEWGLRREELLLDFHTWNAFACARDDGQHYGADRHPCTFPATQVNVDAVAEAAFFEDDAGGFAARYAEAELEDAEEASVAVECVQDGTGAGRWIRLVALGLDGARLESAEAFVDGEGTLRLRDAYGAGDRALLVAMSEEDPAAALECSLRRVPAIVDPPEPPPPSEGTDCTCHAATDGGAAGGLVLLGLAARRRRRALRAPSRSSTPGGAC